MKLPKKIKPSWDEGEQNCAGRLRRFLVRHGEKIAAGVVIVAALWVALQVQNYQPLSWQPDELEKLVSSTEEAIKNNGFAVENKDIRIFDYAAHAEQIREQIPSEFYRSHATWYPVIHPAPQPLSGFEVLTVTSFWGAAVRRAGLTTQGKLTETAAENQNTSQDARAIWVNLYGTIPFWEQWDIYNQVFNHTDSTNRPEYVYYELEKTEIKLNEESLWQPVIVKSAGELPPDQHLDFVPNLLSFEQKQESLQEPDLFLFSDFDVEPAKTYAYRIRVYVRNPNYNLQETSVEEGVDTKSELIRSDWSLFARVYVPDRTLVQLQSVTPTDPSDFPRQTGPLRPIRGTLFLDYFDIELGQSLPLVEKTEVFRGMLGNMSKNDANRYISRGTGDVVINYPDTGLRSNVCVLDFSGGRRLQKRPTREAQGSPDLFVPGKALLLMPDGTMHVISTEPELFR